MFELQILPFEENLFSSLVMEQVTTGRQGIILREEKNGLFPIVRSTTRYQLPASSFPPSFLRLKKEVEKVCGKELNNAMVEVYDSRYRSMKFHSDLSLDLEEGSQICIFSCYDKAGSTRTLVIKDKITGEEREIELLHNSLVSFSTETNRRYLHKIIQKGSSGSRWLGVTLRKSNSYVQFKEGIPYLNNDVLHLASHEEEREFFSLRRTENQSLSFEYPFLNYTVSEDDLLPNKEYLPTLD